MTATLMKTIPAAGMIVMMAMPLSIPELKKFAGMALMNIAMARLLIVRPILMAEEAVAAMTVAGAWFRRGRL